jgi:chemotaxis protein MotB
MSHRVLSLALAGTFALTACVSSDEYMRLKGEKDALQVQHDDLVRYQKELQERLAGLERRASELQANATEAGAVKELQKRLRETLDKLKAERGSTLPLAPLEGVSIVERADGVGFQVEGAVLFDSGQATLKGSGEETLRKLIPELAKTTGTVRVDGHTDSDPIARSRWRSNLHLAAERATVVGEFLVGNGFPPERLFVAGFGEHRPDADGNTDEVKRRNRRVEILVMR